MKLVTSRDNPIFKGLRKTAQAAGGAREPQLLIDGPHLCEAWLDRHGEPVRAIFDTDRLDVPALSALRARLPEALCLGLPGALMANLSQVEADQGVLFLVDHPESQLPARLDMNFIWLDRVQDPGNVGTILRTAAAAGVGQVLLSPGCASVWSPKVLRSGQGAHFLLSLHEQVDLDTLQARRDVPLVVTTLQGAEALYQTTLPAQCGWVFGHEGQGVSATVQALADLRIRIDHDPRVESLNVAMAAALCLFEQRRQHMANSGH